MAGRFEGRVAVVTGAGSGIGREVALQLAGEGARLLLADVEMEWVSEVAASLGAAQARPHRADVRVAADVEAMLVAAETAFGGVDIVCNNAGVLTTAAGLEGVPDGDWDRTLAINLRGVILGCALAIPHLRSRGGGAIVNTASMAGISGLASDPVYAASKGGVIALTRSLRSLEAEARIRVTCVCPSFVNTPMVQGAHGLDEAIARFGLLEASEVARAIVFLASDEAAGLGGRAVRVVAGEPPALLGNPRPEGELFETGGADRSPGPFPSGEGEA
jgi:meso-butanediol dehydrogenase / (S,S)-butanediol dehydrogenase / diacetyl reductase